MVINSDKLKQWLSESMGYGHDNVYREVLKEVESLEAEDTTDSQIRQSIVYLNELADSNDFPPTQRERFLGASEGCMRCLDIIGGKDGQHTDD